MTSIKRVASLHMLEPLMAVLYVVWLLQARTLYLGFDFDFDEGLNLMKAALIRRGFRLYSDIWNDQAPLFSHLLGLLWQVFDETVTSARIITLQFAGILLWAAARFLRSQGGLSHAIAAVLILTQVPNFQNLSISTMIGLPSISIALCSLLAINRWHLTKHKRWLVLSGCLLAASVMTKFFTVALGAVIFCGLLLSGIAGGSREWRERLAPALYWSVGFLSVLSIITATLLGALGAYQLYSPHLAAQSLTYFNNGAFVTIGFQLANSRWVLWLAAAGIPFILWRRRWMLLYPAAWMLLNWLLLYLHRPVRYHQCLLITVPAALIAAFACGELLSLLSKMMKRRPLGTASVILASALLGWHLGFWAAVASKITTNPKFNTYAKPRTRELETQAVVEELRAVSADREYIIADLPAYAFRAGLLTPPAFAVFSQKRLRVGEISEKDLISAIPQLDWPPVLLGRFPLPEFRGYMIHNGYTGAKIAPGIELFTADEFRSFKTRSAWKQIFARPAEWYRGAEAAGIADTVVRLQLAHGGWPKNLDPNVKYTASQISEIKGSTASRFFETIDNGATTSQIRFLTRVLAETGDEKLKTPITRGVTFLLDTQYSAGGWPQREAPKGEQYPRLITFNDDATVNVLETLRAVETSPDLSFLASDLRERAVEARKRGLDLILRAQIKKGGIPTAWCAQYLPDGVTPVGARRFEPPSISGHESVAIIRYLMEVENPSKEVIAAVDAAAAWLNRVAIQDLELVEERSGPDHALVNRTIRSRPAARRIWARFYDLTSDTPLFYDRDGKPKPSFNDLSLERRIGYNYFSFAASQLLDYEYPAWRARLQAENG